MSRLESFSGRSGKDERTFFGLYEPLSESPRVTTESPRVTTLCQIRHRVRGLRHRVRGLRQRVVTPPSESPTKSPRKRPQKSPQKRPTMSKPIWAESGHTIGKPGSASMEQVSTEHIRSVVGWLLSSELMGWSQRFDWSIGGRLRRTLERHS